MRIARRAHILLPLAIIACGGSSTTTARPNRAPRPSSDVITREQWESRGGGLNTAYDIVEALHGNWLRLRSGVSTTGPGRAPSPATQRSDSGARNPFTSSSGASPRDSARSDPGANAGIQVYLDGIRVGGVQELKRIASHTILSIRHYTGPEAQTRFGPGHSDGVIAVSTRPEQP